MAVFNLAAFSKKCIGLVKKQNGPTIFGGIKETARGRDQATAVSLAANIMTQLIVLVFGNRHRAKVLEAFKMLDS